MLLIQSFEESEMSCTLVLSKITPTGSYSTNLVFIFGFGWYSYSNEFIETLKLGPEPKALDKFWAIYRVSIPLI